jgi:beta-carotene 3-hydroxylase
VSVATSVLAGLAAFVVMEPLTYAAHRWVMHGVGWVLHRSHHRRRRISTWRDRFEANDWFPVAFAGVTIAAFALGTSLRSAELLVPVAVGVTLYGATYAFVHDVYIHGRIARLPVLAPLERLRDAHAIHHLYGGEPYGMLCPVVPKALRERAASARVDPLAARVA